MREVDSQSLICIGNGCYLDLDGDILIKDGRIKYLSPIAFRLLRYLAEHLGEAVASEELICRAWGKGAIDKRDELYVYIRQIRIELEDDPNQPRCLKTVRKFGYVLCPFQK
jgi:DNA-binding response OmpR family regulator